MQTFQDILNGLQVDLDTAIFVFSERFMSIDESSYQTATGKKILDLTSVDFIGILKFVGSDVPLFHPCLYIQDKNHTWKNKSYTFDFEQLDDPAIPKDLYFKFLTDRHKDWPPSGIPIET